MTGDSSRRPYTDDHLGSPFPTLPRNRYGTIRFSMILLWIDKETLHPEAAIELGGGTVYRRVIKLSKEKYPRVRLRDN